MRSFSFENLDAYKSSLELVDRVYNLINKFPNEERYALSDQLRRAVISVPSNIAEGSGRMSLKEKTRFLEISYGSLMEVYCQLQIAFKRQYITEVEYNGCKVMTHNVSKLITGLHDYFASKAQ